MGQDAIEFVAQALGVPLYRQVIHGSAIEQGSEYGGRAANDAGGIPGDETEDLFALLSTVKVNLNFGPSVSLINARTIIEPSSVYRGSGCRRHPLELPAS